MTGKNLDNCMHFMRSMRSVHKQESLFHAVLLLSLLTAI